jgi:ABC-2 type transport system permease protein
MATLARSMPQFGMLAVLILLPLDVLSGNITPRESMPELVRDVMLVAPPTHESGLIRVLRSQAIRIGSGS